MYLKMKVKIPDVKGNIVINKKGLVLYETERKYNEEKKYNVPNRVSIGKVCDNGKMMIPTNRYSMYFYDENLTQDIKDTYRSRCIRVGTYIVFREIIKQKGIFEILESIFEDYAGLIIDLACYMIVDGNNASQYYEDYAYNHLQFTKEYKIYSDSTISKVLNVISDNQRISFLNQWNENRDVKDKIYITYDSTNKNCQAGEIEIAEYGHAKDDDSKPIINMSLAYDHNNNEPLFYETYPGSIVDISQLQYMIDKAKGYGYKNIGIILDRGYFSRKNLEYIEENGYDFIVMAKSTSKFVSGVIKEAVGTFEEERKNRIGKWSIYGKTIRKEIFDERIRYVHIYYNEKRSAKEREEIEDKIYNLEKIYKRFIGTKNELIGAEKYFSIERDKKNIITVILPKNRIIQEEKKLCGYFTIITSKRMTATEAISLYKSRDVSEKIFRMDISYLGNRTYRVQSESSIKTKMMIEFISLIIRNEMYKCLDKAIEEPINRQNYMTVPATIKELEKIEMIKQGNGQYRLDCAITATQSKILNAYGINPKTIVEKANYLSMELEKYGF